MAKCAVCGKWGPFIKLYDGMCISCLQSSLAESKKKIQNLEAELTPDVRSIIKDPVSYLSQKEEENTKHFLEQKALYEKKIEEMNENIKRAQNSLIVAEDAIELETFSLYQPKYDFTNSEEYKVRLNEIREKQKEMIRNKTAATCSQEWTVNGSKSEGKKMTNDIIKLFLRSFNNECDIAVSSVRFNNYDRCSDRITKSFETLNNLGRVNMVSISSRYMVLKIEELRLALEYQQKKQEEKEAIRELRAQQREEARLAKEIEEARKEAEKEKKHYIQALEKVNMQILSCKSDEERQALLEKKEDLSAHVDDITSKLSDIDYRQQNQRAGYVYVISNIGSFGEGIYKIGMTRRLDPMERVDELGDASVPFTFDVHAMIFSDDAPKLEAALHNAFEKNRVNLINRRREYFKVSLDEIKRVVRENHDKTVEFIDNPRAEQYRESIRISQ